MLNRRTLIKSLGAGAALLPVAAAHAKESPRAESAVPEKWDETYDVIVIGAGGAGMAAAVKAAIRSLLKDRSTRRTRFVSRNRASRTVPNFTPSRRSKRATSAGIRNACVFSAKTPTTPSPGLKASA